MNTPGDKQLEKESLDLFATFVSCKPVQSYEQEEKLEAETSAANETS